MIQFESIFYGIKALLYGLPISIGVGYLLYLAFGLNFDIAFQIPLTSLIIVSVGVFIVVGSTMLYSTKKLKKDNIVETLKNENN